MAWKTILTVLTGEGDKTQLEAAIALAAREDAHLDVLCLGFDGSQAGYLYAGTAVIVVQEAIESAMEAASALQDMVSARLKAEPIRWSVEGVVAAFGGIAPAVGLRARYADLMVSARPYGAAAQPGTEAVVEAALFEGGCPVLVLAGDTLPEDFDSRVLLAWNESDEALAAARITMPVLTRAEAVEIAVIDPAADSREQSDPGGALCQMMGRHGVKASIAVLARTQPRISEVLNRHATETGAGLIVMGAYGHSRLREAILGGTTRSMLQTASVPVLMAR